MCEIPKNPLACRSHGVDKSYSEANNSSDKGWRGRTDFPGSNDAIAFANGPICRMNPDGFGQIQLSDVSGTNLNPDWSADGKKIAFANFVNISGEVYWMNSYGENTSEKNLTSHAAFDSDPSFFPDYHTIAFTSNRDGGDNDIFKMKADGSNQVNLTTNGATHDEGPSWQPDP